MIANRDKPETQIFNIDNSRKVDQENPVEDKTQIIPKMCTDSIEGALTTWQALI